MKYFFGFLAVVALVVLVFILVLRGFGGRENNLQTDLTDYAQTQTVMRLTIEGKVNADVDHRLVRITVGRTTNTVEVIEGYEGRVTQTKTYPNNEAAYYTFLRALQLQGYILGDDNPELAESRGVCPTGKQYGFDIITGSDTVQHFWKTSCDTGTFEGNSAMIIRLFKAQITDYSKAVKGTGL